VPYDLRHTFASILLSKNAPILYVSKQLGHSKADTTLRYYAKWLPSGHERFVNMLDQAKKTRFRKKFWQLAPTVGTKLTESRLRTRNLLRKMVGRVGVEPTAR
jgi:hypothetical protein